MIVLNGKAAKNGSGKTVKITNAQEEAMVAQNTNVKEKLSGIFLEVTGDGERRLVPLNQVRYFYQSGKEMEILHTRGGKYYTTSKIEGVTFDEAKEKLAKIPGVKILNLAKM